MITVPYSLLCVKIETGVLFDFVNFTQTQVIFYSKLTSKNIPFLLYMCSCIQSRSLRRKLCSIS